MRRTLPARSSISSSAASWPNWGRAYPAHQSRENFRTITGLRPDAIVLDCRTGEPSRPKYKSSERDAMPLRNSFKGSFREDRRNEVSDPEIGTLLTRHNRAGQLLKHSSQAGRVVIKYSFATSAGCGVRVTASDTWQGLVGRKRKRNA